ncbi:sporulation integral membrane protein YtvI [Paenibacillus xerothermodurans]|uniref:Sporulation integral membrane protein YtvI n=1 Tax=Paenibacillus xerothermodurans TaxID=1977292 RepID=A0A2W1N8Q7_PAEXE|nr:sporulation integral membrane protein YtvI [Paenibacillus xerothermodurans]PZE20999.1 sporulation integral membrane protein YtvI [Paenibacillus xerothermodurans]
MIAFYKKYWKTVFDIALLILTVYLFMTLFSYLYRIATPIFLAFVVYLIIEPLARFLHKRRISKSIASAISIIVFVLVLLGAITGAGAILTSQILNLRERLPEYAAILQKQLASKNDLLHDRIAALPDDLVQRMAEYATQFAQRATELAGQFLTGTFTMLTSFSAFLVNFIIAIILAYFLSIEIETWKRAAREHTPKTFKSAFIFLRENVLQGIVGYLKAQAKLISLTFGVVLVALVALGVNNAFAVALLAALLDVLPLLGVATLFVPWIIYLFIVGQTTLAIWLSALLAVVVLVRQIMEPKITGDTLGVSAFTMLSFMIISLSLFGVAGLILSPVLIITIKALYEQGHLQRWIRWPEGE